MATDPQSYPSYLRLQAENFRAQNTEYSLKLAYELETMATYLERRDARRAAKPEPAF